MVKCRLASSFCCFAAIIVAASAVSKEVFDDVDNKESRQFTDSEFVFDKGKPLSLEDYLSPRLFEDPNTMKEIGRMLHEERLVIIRNAFVEEFADTVWNDLNTNEEMFDLHEGYGKLGFNYRHHNVYELSKYTDIMNDTLALFSSDSTKKFMTELSGRDCSGDVTGSPSWYKTGDHSTMHSDLVGQRAVAYVWHLSRQWQPEWGGALYWAQEHMQTGAYNHASYNTLVLFSVTKRSDHMVTSVTRHASQKRLAFNGWFTSSWYPTLDDDFENWFLTEEKRRTVTQLQRTRMTIVYYNSKNLGKLSGERKEKMKKLLDEIQSEPESNKTVCVF